jgi:hypothetical protein
MKSYSYFLDDLPSPAKGVVPAVVQKRKERQKLLESDLSIDGKSDIVEEDWE